MYAARFERFVVASGRNSLEQFRGKRPQSSGFRRIIPATPTSEGRQMTLVRTTTLRQLPVLDASPRQMLYAAM